MNTAVDGDLIEASPVHIRGAGYRPKRRRLEPATIEELDTIVEHMPDKWKLMILLASWCALRYGEIAELRRKDIKLRHVGGHWTGVIQVRRGVVFVKAEIRVEPPKSEAGIRDVAIPPHLIPVIKEHLETHAAPGQEGPLFPSDTKRQQWPSTITGYFKKATEAAGRSDLRFHDLRHTAQSWLPSRGNARGPAGSPGPLHRERGTPLPAHGQRARSADRREPLEAGQRLTRCHARQSNSLGGNRWPDSG